MSLKFGFVAQDIIDTGKISWDEINVIKKWLETRSDLPKYTDEQIICFHLACDKDDEATKATLKSYNAIRNECPEIFSKRHLDDPILKRMLSVINYCLLPKRTEDNCVIIYCKFIDTNYLNFDHTANLKMTYMVLDAILYDDPPNGFILILDMKGMGLMHLTRLKISLMKISGRYLQTGLPVKLKNVHLINAAYITGKLLGMIKALVSDHVFKKIICHTRGNMGTFSENYIPKEYLPLELNGELPSIDVLNEKTLQKLRSIQAHFDAEEKQREENIIV